MGLDEADVPAPALDHLARGCRRSGARVEVNEKWACPSPRTIRALAAAGVPLVASTDSHDCATIGRYQRVQDILDAALRRAVPGCDFLLAIKSLLVAFVILGALPLLVANYQFLLVGLHFRRLHYAKCRAYFPRVAIVVPAWNEGAVIGTSIDRLMRLEYPRERCGSMSWTMPAPMTRRRSSGEDPSTPARSSTCAARTAGRARRDPEPRHAGILADDWMEAC